MKILSLRYQVAEALEAGWQDGVLGLAFVHEEEHPVPGIYLREVKARVETLEGKTYDAYLYRSSSWPLAHTNAEGTDSVTIGTISPKGNSERASEGLALPPQLPISMVTRAHPDWDLHDRAFYQPHYSEASHYVVGFRFASGAHPSRLVLTTLDGAYQVDIPAPASHGEDGLLPADGVSGRSLTELEMEMKQLNPNVDVRFGQCTRDETYPHSFRLPYQVINSNNLDEERVLVDHALWYSSGLYIAASTAVGSPFRAGPGQTVVDAFLLTSEGSVPTYFVLYSKEGPIPYSLGCEPDSLAAPTSLQDEPDAMVTATMTDVPPTLTPILTPSSTPTRTATAVPTPTPTTSPVEGASEEQVEKLSGLGYFAFVSAADPDNLDIYVMPVDGSRRARLTDDPAVDILPIWSPDGRRIAFVRYYDGSSDIYVMDADGTQAVRLTNFAGADAISWPGQLAWSPSGDMIAFGRSIGEHRSVICIVTLETGDLVCLNSDFYSASQPSWSPDGRSIAFRGVEREDRLVDGIYVMNADGSDPHLVSGNRPGAFPIWSPDGGPIAFACGDENDEGRDICLVYPDGSGLSYLTDWASRETATSWSPDGRFLAFDFSDRDDAVDVKVIDTITLEVFDITDTGSDHGATWSWGP